MLGHLGELGDDLGDGVVLTHMVDLEAGEGDASVEVTNQIHVLQLLDNGVFEAFFE